MKGKSRNIPNDLLLFDNFSGTIVRVACGKGYGLNLEPNATAKCVRGRWKPEKPKCEICKFYHNSFILSS